MTEWVRRLQARRVGGVEIRILLNYSSELSRTTRLALHEYDRFRRRLAVRNANATPGTVDDDVARLDDLELFAAIENFLGLHARTSLLLFPTSRKAVARGAALRAFLGVADADPIGARHLRNAWMHYDERLDKVIRERDRGGWDFMILEGASKAAPGFKREVIRLLDPETEDLCFLGERFSLRDMAAAIAAVREKIAPAMASIAADVSSRADR